MLSFTYKLSVVMLNVVTLSAMTPKQTCLSRPYQVLNPFLMFKNGATTLNLTTLSILCSALVVSVVLKASMLTGIIPPIILFVLSSKVFVWHFMPGSIFSCKEPTLSILILYLKWLEDLMIQIMGHSSINSSYK
jgi:hypothetical protein